MKHLLLIALVTMILPGAGLAADQQSGSSAPPGPARADYERAQALRGRYNELTIDMPDAATWVGATNRFDYRKTVKGGSQFVMVECRDAAEAASGCQT